MILVFILFSFFIVGEILQPSGGHVQGKGILIAGMGPDLSYDNTRNKRLNFSRMKWTPIYFYWNSSRFRSFPVSKF